MIQWIKIKDLSERQRLILSFQPEDSAWIVPDIKTKLYLQTELLKRHAFFPAFFPAFLPGPCVMRARELYQELFDSSSIPWHLTSDLFVEQLMSEFLETSNQFLKISSSTNRSVKSFFELFNAFLPVFLHPEGSALLKEWMDKKTSSPVWWDIFEWSQSFFDSLKSQKIIHRSGLKALLASQLPLIRGSCFVKQKIFVDLAFSLDFYEVEIFKELGREKEVYILSPELKRPHFFKGLNIYQQMEELMGKDSFYFVSPTEENEAVLFEKDRLVKEERGYERHKEKDSLSPVSPTKENGTALFQKDRLVKEEGVLDEQTSKNSTFARFFKVECKTQLGEIKSAVAQSLKWMDQGIAPSKIALFAPDMEELWFALRHCLKREGVPVQKSIFASGGEYPAVRHFLAALRMSLKKASFEDLESFAYYDKGETETRLKDFSAFKARYFDAPEKHYTKAHFSVEKKISAREFIQRAFYLWPISAPDFLLEKISKLLQGFPMEAQLKTEAWLNVLEKELSSLEVELEPEEEGGISVLSLNALSSVKNPYVFIIGLGEKSLKPSSLSIIKESERESLLNDLSLPPLFPNREEKEDGLLWFLKSSHLKEVFLSCASYNFKGEAQTASSLYLMSELLFSAEEVKVQNRLSWDDRKRQTQVPKILSGLVDKEVARQIEKFILEPAEKGSCFFQKQEIRLSPNSIQLFFDCPFKYAAEKIFFAHSPPPVKRELSSLLKGSRVHQLFEEALRDGLSAEDEAEIHQLIEELEPEENDLIYEQQKLIVKDYLKILLKDFFEKEEEIKDQLPLSTKLKPVAFEAQCHTRWNQSKGELDQIGEYAFQAKIDRIDREEETGTYVIRDYKSKPGDLTANIPNWLKEGKEELQLSFYAQALQKGLVEGLPKGEVSSLFYSFYNKGFAAKGFEEKGGAAEGLMGEGKSFKKDQRDLDQAIQAGNRRLKLIVEEMEKGRFFPQPRNEKLCPSCSFKHWCRFKNAT